MYIETGTRDKRRIIDLAAIEDSLASQISEHANYTIDDLLFALFGLHSFTGCDSVSALAGKGKAKALNLMMSSDIYVTTFLNLGSSFGILPEEFDLLERFTCRLYGSAKETIDSVRYRLYCLKQGKIPLTQLPPCQNAFKKHCQRANYQCKIWRLSLEAEQDVNNPIRHGWIDDSDGNLVIDWMDCDPVPQTVSCLIVGR